MLFRSPAAGGRRPLNAVRKRTAAHTTRAWQTIPHVLQAVEVDFHRVQQARAAIGDAWMQREGFELTYLAFIASAVASSLRKFPLLNASMDGDDLVVHGRVNLGIAVDLAFEGLIVPVVKDADTLSVAQLARAIRSLAQSARASRLKPDDVAGATRSEEHTSKLQSH